VSDRDALARAFVGLASAAGRVVMEVYATDFEVRSKDDRSPVSDADEPAEALLVPGVEKLLPGVPVVAEEAVSAGGLPSLGDEFVLIDPLDGTREFTERRGDFTVNVALVRDGVPVAGAVYAPARERMFVGGSTAGGADLAPGTTSATSRRCAPASTRRTGSSSSPAARSWTTRPASSWTACGRPARAAPARRWCSACSPPGSPTSTPVSCRR
jgi:3'(2'), 5'-bisphosphate nucleotidase